MYSKILVPIDTSYKSDYWLKAPLRTAYEMVIHPDGVIHVMSVIPHNIYEGYYPNIYIKEVIDETKKKLDKARNNNYTLPLVFFLTEKRLFFLEV